MTLYKGLSTRNYETSRSFSLYDVELVKEDLLNHIFTEKGERIHMPEWGTRIPLLIFEPGDDETIRVVEEDLKEVFSQDPRVELLALSVFHSIDRHSIIAISKLLYKEFEVTDDLNIEIKSR